MKINDMFWLSQKSASNLILMTKWKTYLIWMQNCKCCFTLQVAHYIIYAGLQPPSSKHWGSFLSGSYRIELWVNYLSIIEQITSKTKWIRKFPIFEMAAMLWRDMVIKSDNDPGLVKWWQNTDHWEIELLCLNILNKVLINKSHSFNQSGNSSQGHFLKFFRAYSLSFMSKFSWSLSSASGS